MYQFNKHHTRSNKASREILGSHPPTLSFNTLNKNWTQATNNIYHQHIYIMQFNTKVTHHKGWS